MLRASKAPHLYFDYDLGDFPSEFYNLGDPFCGFALYTYLCTISIAESGLIGAPYFESDM